MSTTLVNIPEGTEKIGLTKMEGWPWRVWWAAPDGSMFSTNLEGTDALALPFGRLVANMDDDTAFYADLNPVLKDMAASLKVEGTSITDNG